MTDTIHSSLAARPAVARLVLPDTAPYWVLRFGAALCFIGHGAFGFITKRAWVPYFAVVGIPESWAFRLMPVIGAVDVLVGMAILFGPTRLPAVYMTIWAVWTALLRPLSGESVFELIERAGNYGVPLAFLLMGGLGRSWRWLFEELPVRADPVASERLVRRVLQATTCLLLAGHGALGIAGKTLLTNQYVGLGLPATMTPWVGWIEVALAVAVLVRPGVGLLVAVCAWKLTSESLFLVGGSPIWELVERAGSYAAPLALATLIARKQAHSIES